MLVLTRPAKQAKQDIAFFRENGIECLSAPMINIHRICYSDISFEHFDCLIFTSANALDFLDIPKRYLKIPVVVVGAQTAEASSDKGFTSIKNCEGSAQDIIDYIARSAGLKSKRFLYVRGKDVRLDIAASLAALKIKCDDLIVYESVVTEKMPDNLAGLLNNSEIKGVSFLSVRTAENFARLVRVNELENALQSTKALCISDSVLECVRVFNWGSTHVCSAPDGDAMKDLILSEFATNDVM